jgi:ribose transport system ATP-binding protein
VGLITGSSATPAALAVAGVVKRFGEQRALDDVSLTLQAGEVHGLLGENGSGKSTLIKILSGYYRPDAGSLELGGTPVPLPLGPARAAELGLQFVHQDLGLIPSLSVAENLGLQAMARGQGARSRRGLAAAARAALARYDVDIDPDADIASIPAVDRALVAITRAVHALETEAETRHGTGTGTGATRLTRVLVLDEPTVFLPRADVERLFRLVRSLAARDCAILLVSHDLDEIAELTDRVTVLRNGRVAGTRLTAECSHDDLVRLIVGRQVDLTRPAGPAAVSSGAPGEAAAYVRINGLSTGTVTDLHLDVAPGEILGLTGLAGSGYEEICYALYGARRAAAGTLTLDETALSLPSLRPSRALNAGITLLPADRRRTGGIGSLTVDDNVTLPRLGGFRSPAGLRRRAMRRDTASLLDRFDVRPRDPRHLFGTLSGGNQQKALLSKWLATEPRVLLIDEPTQGVDIGARQQIFAVLREMADRGVTVICASTDHEQLAVLTDRTVVLARGRVVAELSGDSLTKQRLTESCFDQVPGAA